MTTLRHIDPRYQELADALADGSQVNANRLIDELARANQPDPARATGYTHYSLFDRTTVLADFARIPEGGLRELLADLHARSAASDNLCVAIGPDDRGHCGTLHPGAEQVSFTIGRRYALILMTRDALLIHAEELTAEGNETSAAAAKVALAAPQREHLNTAAPELLAACRKLLDACDGIESAYEPDTIEYHVAHAAAELGRAAIAKATGQQGPRRTPVAN